MRQDFLVFGRPAIEEAEIAEVVATLRSGWIGTGSRVARFEEMFREYIGAPYAVALNSCTAALHLSMIASGVGAGDEVITTPLTFCATANAIIHTGARPVFADVDRSTGNIDPDAVERAITPRTRALVPGMSQDAWKRFSDTGYRHYEVTAPGFKYNMMDLQAALGLHQLPRLAAGTERRRQIWERYDEAFEALPVVRPAPVEAGAIHARHLYTILVDDRLGKTRDQVLDELIALRIGTGVHYTALHLHRYYRERWAFARGDFPNAEHIGDRTLSLPLSPKLTDADVGDVIAAVRSVCGA